MAGRPRAGGVARLGMAAWLGMLGLCSVALSESTPAATSSSTSARLVASPEAGWPQWRGPRRDGICLETGLLQSWPEEGPPLRWRTAGLGQGYSAPIITGGRIYLTGDEEKELRIFALDLEGQTVWQTTNGKSWTGPYPGARAALTYRHDRLFHMNAHGRVVCLDPATGREWWHVNILDRFGGQNITWGLSECLLVDERHVYVTPGGDKALMAALNWENGETVWASAPLLCGNSPSPAQQRIEEPAGQVDQASYTSPILFTLNNRRFLVSCSLRHVFGVDADSGELLWTQPMKTRYQVIAATPLLRGDAVLVAAPDLVGGGTMYQMVPESGGVRVEKLWSSPLDTCHGGFVAADDVIYASAYRWFKGWTALEGATGKELYRTADLAKGSVLWADQRLYCLSEEGDMCLIEPGGKGFAFHGRFRPFAQAGKDVWAHPVIWERRLYLRHHDILACYELAR